MNSIKIPIPVSKEFYFSCKEGDKLDSVFKKGSFLINGDFSKLNVLIKSKEIKKADEGL